MARVSAEPVEQEIPFLKPFKACLAQFLSAALSEITALKITPTINRAFRRRKDLPSMWVSLPLVASSIPRQLNYYGFVLPIKQELQLLEWF